MTAWPQTPDALLAEQRRLAAIDAAPWVPDDPPYDVAGCFVCFPRGGGGPGAAGDPAWAAAALLQGARVLAEAVVRTSAPAPYLGGLLALREGPLLEAAVKTLAHPPAVVLVNATGRDHPRRAGLALHLGAVLGTPTIGVTHRLLAAAGEWAAPAAGAVSPIRLEGEIVGYWLRTRAGKRPLAIHAGWRTTPERAVDVVRATLGGARTPEPLRRARRLARTARARDV